MHVDAVQRQHLCILQVHQLHLARRISPTHTHANSASYPPWDGKYEPAAAAESISSMSTQPPIHCGTGNKNQQRCASISSMSTQPPIHCGTGNKNQQRRAFISSTSTQPPIHCGTGNTNQQRQRSLLAPRQLSLLSTVGREIRTSSSGMSTVYTHQCTFIVHITPNYQALSNYAVRLVRQRVDSIQYGCKKRWENF